MIVHYPDTAESRRELAERIASVHADIVSRYIQKLNCPTDQKLKLLDAVIEAVAENEPENHERQE